MEKVKCLLLIAVIVVSVYVIVSLRTYQFKHPELTDTQRFLHIKEALTWKE